jgi:protein tyrosine phosphatase (PTP) superfamily phosphohydrolase (DUF442 family)
MASRSLPSGQAMLSKVLFVLTITFCAFGAQWLRNANAAEVELAGIVNYRQYSPLLSSSGQPTAAQLAALREAGFERIVFLAFSDHDESLANEDRIVSELGMEYVHIPVDWDAPARSDFYTFASVMKQERRPRTLVHCQVNFRASSFSFLYRVLYEDVDMAQAKDDLDSVWVPNDTWRQFIFDILEESGRSPDCDACLWGAG